MSDLRCALPHGAVCACPLNPRVHITRPLRLHPSQSTSAIHLHSADLDAPPPITITRRLTKRRKPFEGTFGSSSSAPASDTASILFVTGPSQTVTSKIFKCQSIFKSASTFSIAASVVPSKKRQTHSSLLSCFARRLSIM